MKKLLKKFKIADYWHIEIFILVPVMVVWTALLVGIYLNTK